MAVIALIVGSLLSLLCLLPVVVPLVTSAEPPRTPGAPEPGTSLLGISDS